LAVGDNSFRVGDTPAAVASFDESLSIIEDIFRQKPAILMVKQELGRANSLKGDFHLRIGETEKARAHYAAAIALTQNADPVRPQIAQARAFVQGGGAR